MRRNKKLEEDIEGTLREFCGEEGPPIINPTPWKTSTKFKITAVIIILLIISGLFLMSDSYKKGYDQCKFEDALENGELDIRDYPKINLADINKISRINGINRINGRR